MDREAIAPIGAGWSHPWSEARCVSPGDAIGPQVPLRPRSAKQAHLLNAAGHGKTGALANLFWGPVMRGGLIAFVTAVAMAMTPALSYAQAQGTPPAGGGAAGTSATGTAAGGISSGAVVGGAIAAVAVAAAAAAAASGGSSNSPGVTATTTTR